MSGCTFGRVVSVVLLHFCFNATLNLLLTVAFCFTPSCRYLLQSLVLLQAKCLCSLCVCVCVCVFVVVFFCDYSLTN